MRTTAMRTAADQDSIRNEWGRNERGMTLVELAITLAVTGILSLCMGTAMQAMADRVSLNAAVTEVLGDLRYARSMAVREGTPMTVALGGAQPGVTLFRSRDLTHPVAPTRHLQDRGVRAIRSSGGLLLSFQPRGTSATPTTVTLEGRRGDHRILTVSLTGIVRAR